MLSCSRTNLLYYLKDWTCVYDPTGDLVGQVLRRYFEDRAKFAAGAAACDRCWSGNVSNSAQITGLHTPKLAAVLGLHEDEGAHYLGEVALVPQESPIARMNTLFYNTLFDENASCHLAFGNGFPIVLENGTRMTKEQLLSRGINTSNTHVDFMIGSDKLDINGVTAAGNIVPLFRGGNWRM